MSIRLFETKNGVFGPAKAQIKMLAYFQRNKGLSKDDLIDPLLVDTKGRTNLVRMQKGLALIGPDGKSLSLHHMLQSEEADIAEITSAIHKKIML